MQACRPLSDAGKQGRGSTAALPRSATGSSAERSHTSCTIRCASLSCQPSLRSSSSDPTALVALYLRENRKMRRSERP